MYIMLWKNAKCWICSVHANITRDDGVQIAAWPQFIKGLRRIFTAKVMEYFLGTIRDDIVEETF